MSRLYILFVFILIILPNVYALGLNYQIESTTVKSGENFCISGYYMYTLENREESGYLDVSESLVMFTPNYQLIQERAVKEEELTKAKQELRELRALTKSNNSLLNQTEIEHQMGLLDNKLQQINTDIGEIESRFVNTTKEITTVPALDSKIREQFKGNPQGLRDYLVSNGHTKALKLCLKAPEIEKEIKGDCYTKYYKGSAILKYSNENKSSTGSSVSASVGAPLEIQVRCKNLPSTSLTYFIIIGIIAFILLVLLFLVIQHIIISRKKKKQSHY